MPEDVLEPESYTEQIRAENRRVISHIRQALADFLIVGQMERAFQECANLAVTRKDSPASVADEPAARSARVNVR